MKCKINKDGVSNGGLRGIFSPSFKLIFVGDIMKCIECDNLMKLEEDNKIFEIWTCECGLKLEVYSDEVLIPIDSSNDYINSDSDVDWELFI